MSAAAPARQPAAPLAGIAMLTAAAIGYGGNIPYARLAGDLGVSGVDAVALRCACILPMFAAAAWATRTSLAVPRADRVKLLWLGLTTALDADGQKTFASLMAKHLKSGGLIVAATHGPLGIAAKELRIGGGI